MTAYLLRLQDRHLAGARFNLHTGEFVLGRSSSCDLVVHDSTVSRRHARIGMTDGSITVTDLGSLNGTYLDGEQIRAVREVAEDQTLRFGSVSFSSQPTRCVESSSTRLWRRTNAISWRMVARTHQHFPSPRRVSWSGCWTDSPRNKLPLGCASANTPCTTTWGHFPKLPRSFSSRAARDLPSPRQPSDDSQHGIKKGHGSKVGTLGVTP